MVASQNGWRAGDRSVVSTRNVPGTSVRLAVRNGSPGDLLLEAAARFHREVESIEGVVDDWGFADRAVRGSSDISNHASGTAIDLNATRHPLGTAPSANFSAAQIAAIRRIVAATGGVIRWGGDYTGRQDPMHFELNDGTTEAQCTAALARLRGTGSAPPTAAPAPSSSLLQKGSTGARVRELQGVLNRWYPWLHLAEDGIYGDATEAAVRELQRRAGLVVDGVAGPKTLGALHMA